ncbi:VanZ family protein [Paenibacillus tengchongensis]|uniref:VanZ family protein n=1 Tax=Paenibacillus tengchongensis TaxID=2608684 RepID=UPI00124E9B13|nr:VanZ family protein [Paenibacillus tengchongensis]
MKFVFALVWGALLFVFTCAADSSFWSVPEIPYFQWTPYPDFRKMTVIDVMATSQFIIRKIGHCFGFTTFTMLIYWNIKSLKNSFILAVSYAALTEFMQLYFGRDGRIYDILIDSAGVVIGVLLSLSIRKLKS